LWFSLFGILSMARIAPVTAMHAGTDSKGS
jgi:hypothetical protein